MPPEPARRADDEQTPSGLQDPPEIMLQTVGMADAHSRHSWPEHDLALIATLLLTGLRSAELLSLSIDSIAGRAGERPITATGKGVKARTVPVEEPLHDVIAAYLASRQHRFTTTADDRPIGSVLDWAGKPLQRGGLQYLVATTLRRAGLAEDGASAQ